MNKNSLIGIILIIGILVGWSVWMTPSKEQREKIQRYNDSIAQAEQQKRDSLNNGAENVAQEQKVAEPEEKIKANFGAFSSAAEGEEQVFTIENDLIKLTMSSKGGFVKTVQIKNYKTWEGKPLIGFDENTSRFNIPLVLNGSKIVNTYDLYFKAFINGEEVHAGDSIVIDKTTSVVMRAFTNDDSLAFNPDQYLEFKYTLQKDEYMVGFDLETVNMKNVIAASTSSLQIEWSVDILKQEKAVDRYNGTNIFYRLYDDDVESLDSDKDDKQNISNSIQWFSFKQRFFSYSLIAKDRFNSATLEMKSNNPNNVNNCLKSMYARAQVSFNGINENNKIEMCFYFGPNSLKILDRYDIGLDKQIPLGGRLVGWINRYIVVNVFDWLGSYGWNYGIVILILTIIIKLALMPFAYKSYQSSAKMRILKPEIDEINERYPKPEDNMKKQQAIMELYRKAGASPTSGCLPMLLQLPILWAIFRFFPACIELRQQPFLWADDLSTYDSILDLGIDIPYYGDHVSLFTLLMTITTILYTYINNKQMAATNAQGMKGMKIIMYVMPILFLGLFNSYSSGLSYYYMLVNIITFLQMYLFRVFMNDDKLRKKIELAKQKPIKKSRFQKRLEEMQKQQQQMQRRK